MDIMMEITCPECFKKISHVIKVRAIGVVRKVEMTAEGKLVFGKEEKYEQSESAYVCPECSAIIADNEKEIKRLIALENE